MAKRRYIIGGLPVDVVLEEPWTFMEYTETVAERIRAAAAGLPADVWPVRAGDGLVPRTFIKDRSELAGNADARSLNLSQYEPFRSRSDHGGKPLFTITA